MTSLVIIGAGGHAREVAEILQMQGGGEPGRQLVGYIDENPDMGGQVMDGLPVLGGWEWFTDRERHDFEVICAVGSPAVCRKLATRATELGFSFGIAISNRAYVSPLAQVGRGVMVFPHATVHPGAVVGEHVTLNVGATVSHDSRIGRYCNVNPGVHLGGNVSLGEGCYLGMGANVIQECSIGAGTVVAAGAVVLGDLDDNVTAVGNPARIIRRH